MSQSADMGARPERPPLNPWLRRLIYVVVFEALAIILASLGLTLLSGAPVAETGPVTAITSGIAVAWNFAFNAVFEAWEARQVVRGRSLARRLAHAAGFELGLTALIVPLFAWWLGVTLIEALMYDLTLVVFFLVYTFLFNLGFDRVFGLPASAR
ncbi:PACE efflux transporter [Ancylobacter sp. 6x-1]|uniref:PACE efflux transporter n=1 Tax=Ancylobacter crimeensis TaxID=2579147 RepID=A0ABT0DA36_9HYPH|nr:PACE efflux transporter [Ancylobacter crimeensis]MCK0196818.1 PACE efflux transporter [Ancylobacter crimeensis]